MYRCERCQKIFPSKGSDGQRLQQKQVLMPSAVIRLGSYAIALAPRMCYECKDEVIEQIKDILK